MNLSRFKRNSSEHPSNAPRDAWLASPSVRAADIIHSGSFQLHEPRGRRDPYLKIPFQLCRINFLVWDQAERKVGKPGTYRYRHSTAYGSGPCDALTWSLLDHLLYLFNESLPVVANNSQQYINRY